MDEAQDESTDVAETPIEQDSSSKTDNPGTEGNDSSDTAEEVVASDLVNETNIEQQPIGPTTPTAEPIDAQSPEAGISNDIEVQADQGAPTEGSDVPQGDTTSVVPLEQEDTLGKRSPFYACSLLPQSASFLSFQFCK